ncbi:uncharacterized protein VTP21DRAFT_9524 [Calcarisporiella thermophila]|uniref:uncharacterized protein n=1 Tax=Calcarisporiella thermophila TaxID=911321 RepID=UPI0037447E2E
MYFFCGYQHKHVKMGLCDTRAIKEKGLYTEYNKKTPCITSSMGSANGKKEESNAITINYSTRERREKRL